MKKFKIMLVLVAVTGLIAGIYGCTTKMKGSPDQNYYPSSENEQNEPSDDDNSKDNDEDVVTDDSKTDKADTSSGEEKTESDEDEIVYKETVTPDDEGFGGHFKEVLAAHLNTDNLSEMDILYDRIGVVQKGSGDQPITEKVFNYGNYYNDRDQAIKDAFAYGDSGSGSYIVENIINPYDKVSDGLRVRIIDGPDSE